jgi:sec-independent protein translocase protein TatC
MPKQYNEDLFADSTMTFGEHLEELRICLWKAILGLIAGIILGLFVGGPVVNFIQRPLTNALTYYYQNESLNKIKAAAEQSGAVEQQAEKNAFKRIKSGQLLADEVYIDPAELVEELKKYYPEQFTNLPLPQKSLNQHDDKGLVPVFLWRRLADDSRVRVKSFNAHEAFGIYIKAAILVGLLISSPWIFYQIWVFVAAGLYPHEKRYVHLFLPISLGLFFFGAVLAFSFVFEPVLNFLLSFNKWLGIDPDPRISEWIGFVLLLPVGFGLGFQLPLVMYFLERMGIVSAGTFIKHWKIAVLIIWILASILTPPDPYSQLLLGIPLTLLFLGGILLCKYMPARRSGFAEWKEYNAG